MKTAAASLLALNQHMEITTDPEPHSVGRVHTDAAVRYLLGVPRRLPEERDVAPGLRLEAA